MARSKKLGWLTPLDHLRVVESSSHLNMSIREKLRKPSTFNDISIKYAN